MEEAEARRVLRLVHVRRRDEDREALVVKAVQDRPELAARDGVDARRRLVEEEQPRARQERRDERQLLFHPARELAREPRAEAIEADARQEVLRPRFGLRAP